MSARQTAYAISYDAREPFGSAQFTYLGVLITRTCEGWWRVAGQRRLYFTFDGARMAIERAAR